MSDVIDTHGSPTHLEDDHDLIENLARYSEGLLSKEAVKKKHRLADIVWQQMGEDDRLVELVEDAKLRRIRTGLAKREKSQILVTKAPDVLSGIMLDPAANNRHKVDAIKVLDQLADNGPQTAATAAMFNIVINLGTDVDGKEIVERYSQPIAIGVEDVGPNEAGTDTAPREVIAAIATKKRVTDGGQGYL
jgi:hypothetical protein